MANNNDLRTRLGYVQALLETIVEAGTEGAPSGICYMAMQMHGVDINAYTSMVEGLKSAGLVTCKAHVLRATSKTLKLMAKQ